MLTQHSRFGYVEFVNAGDAAKAHAAKKGALIDNRALNLDFANKRSNDGQQDRAQSRAKSFGDSTSPPSDTLFVGNLSFDAGQETVSEAFGEWGTVLGVRLPTDRETGDPKGFGYVTFSSVDEAKAALENMQGAEIGGRACRLDFSQPRPQNGESGGRGGGFGGRGGGRGGFGGRGGGRGGFGDRGGRGGRGRGGFGDRGGRGGRGGSTNRGGFGDFSGKKVTF
jgi:nucleolin